MRPLVMRVSQAVNSHRCNTQGKIEDQNTEWASSACKQLVVRQQTGIERHIGYVQTTQNRQKFPALPSTTSESSDDAGKGDY